MKSYRTEELDAIKVNFRKKGNLSLCKEKYTKGLSLIIDIRGRRRKFKKENFNC